MNDETVRTKIEQGRAEFAFKCAEEGKEHGTKYKSQINKIPMMIKTNGLGATLAFIYSKKDKKKEGPVFKLIGRQIKDWINLHDKYKYYFGDEKLKDFEHLVEKVVEINSPQYRALTVEILALFNWLRRFAEGMIEGEA